MHTQDRNGYMLLYRSSEWYKTLSQEELQKLIKQNKAWFERLTAQGKAKPGRALERTGVTVSGQNGRFVMDGPFAESKEAIGGYLILDVETIEEAIAIARAARALLMAVQSKCGRWLKNVPSTSARVSWREKN